MKTFLDSKLFKKTVIPLSAAIVFIAVIVLISMSLSSGQNIAAAETLPSPSATQQPEPTQMPTPMPRKAYIPDPSELADVPKPAHLWTTEGFINAAYDSESLLVGWDTVEGADYYLLCVLDESDNIIQREILWADVDGWPLFGYCGERVLLIAYQDMGEDSAEDDVIVGAFAKAAQPLPSDLPDDGMPEPPPGLNKYYIIVDKEDHAFATFTYDENFEYTKLVVTYPCAIGRSSRMTPAGTFEISSKGRWKHWNDGSYSPYYTKFTSGLYFHGAIYRSRNGASMKPKSYNQIGTNASSGCIRTTMVGARWVYFNCPAGTVVEIVESSDLVDNPGLPPIDPEYPRWDPTDPNKPKSTAEPAQ